MTVNILTDNIETPAPEGLPSLPEHIVVRQFYMGCLSQAAYLVGDRRSGRAAVVDPPRDIDAIVDAAREEGLSIEWVLETHFHADFLSGHLELAAATGATIGVGARGETEFASEALEDGRLLDLGGVQLQVMETPGHTPESVCFLVLPEVGAQPVAILTGDTLFIGDVGRPDLLASIGVTADQLGTMLYSSVQRLLGLPDEVLVLPAHGAGSACGKSLSTETVSTMGVQRRTNYALQPMDEGAFVALVTEGQPSAPGYFVYDAILNRKDRPLLDEHEAPTPMSLAEVDAAMADGAVLLDTRPPEVFALGHLPGAVNVGLGGRFSEQAGSVIPPDRPVVLFGEPGTGAEAKVRLGRIGFDRILGELTDGEAVLVAHPERAVRASRLTAVEVEDRVRALPELQLVDVRNAGEVEAAAVPIDGVLNIPLARLAEQLDDLDPTHPTVVVCAGGYRSSIAASLLRRAGFEDVSDVLGGAAALGATTACSLGATEAED